MTREEKKEAKKIAKAEKKVAKQAKKTAKKIAKAEKKLAKANKKAAKKIAKAEKKLAKIAARPQIEENKAIRNLRFLLLRVWFIKNWFTILVILTVIVLAATVSGLMPENLPVVGTYSYALRDALQEFLEIGDAEFYSLFGSITGIFSLLFSLGYASSKIKSVSYYMIDKDKLKEALKKAKLTLTDKGKIISIEKRLGIDLDGDNMIGNDPYTLEDSNNLFAEIVGTFSELSTIVNIDREVLKQAVKENKPVPEVSAPDPNAVAVVEKKPATMFRPNKF